ncbi:hypothetical protein V6N13_059265 [Hibiscus sabdariffa]
MAHSPRSAWISARNDQPRQIKETSDKSCTEATLTKRTRNHPGREITVCRDSRPRQRRKIQKGLRSDQNIFLSIPIQRAHQKKAGKTKRVGIKAHALKVYLEYKSQPKEVLL